MSIKTTQHVFGVEQFQTMAPDVFSALLTMSKAVDESGLDKTLTELVKIRISQINQCAFCTQYHLNIARKIGISQTKLDRVAAWRDAGIFSAREMAALAWAEQETRLADRVMPTHPVENELARHFTEVEILHLTVAIANINAWNRIAGSLHFAPPVA